MRAPMEADRESVKHRATWPRFRDAFSGMCQAYREEPNLRFHLFAGTCVAVTGYAVRVEGWEAAYLAVTVSLVLLAEMVNTAVERAVDLAADGRRHVLAAQAKQVAAATVLLAAVHATFAAFFIFLIERTFWSTAMAVWNLAVDSPWIMLFPIGAAVLGYFGGGGSHRAN